MMPYQIFKLPKASLASSLELKAGWYVTFFLTGTTTPTPVYTTSALSTTHTQPVVADSGGTLAAIYLDPSIVYKVSVYDENDVLQYTVDPCNDNLVTQASVGAALFPIISGGAEDSLGLTDDDLYLYHPYGDVRRFKPALDGSTDDTAALQNWLSVGGDLTWPVPATAKITSALAMVSNTRLVAVSGAVIRQYTANTDVIGATSKTDISVRGLKCYGVGSATTSYNGCGFAISNCSRVDISECWVVNTRGWSYMFDTCDNCSLTNSRSTDAYVAGWTDHTDVRGDVAVYDSSNCRVIGNYLISGNGIGVNVQNVQDNSSCLDNIVSNNIIKDCLQYGINLYRGGTGTTHSGTVVSGNDINNVTGEVPEATDGLVYGNGIYAVNASNFVISNNRVTGSHSDSHTVVDTLAAAAIGTTICGAHVIEGNVIRDAGYNGISVRNPTGDALGGQPVTVTGNALYDITRYGIEVQDRGNLSIVGNRVNTTTSDGIIVYAPTLSTKVAGVVVSSNSVASATGRGISIDYTTSAVIHGNSVNTSGSDGIGVQHSDDPIVSDNNSLAAGSGAYGVGIYTTNARPVITGNTVRGTSTAPDYAYYFGVWWKRNQTNYHSNCAAAFLGDYLPEHSAAPTAGTHVVGDKVWGTTPAAGGTMGWVCTSAGTPGTWKTFGTIAA